jgi:hypothetical protein
MKPDIEYLRLAVEIWCKRNRWDKDLPMTPSWLFEMLTTSKDLRDADKKKLEETEPTA